jgi:cytochrome c peroxidase
VLEVRQDMSTPAEGSMSTATTRRGYNTPSLLGAVAGAPYFHAGNARTLEELFDPMFAGHYQSAIAQVFAPSAADIRALIAFLLSIDEDHPPDVLPPPALGARGGDMCRFF